MHIDVLHMIAKYKNICNYIHLPVQSGSTRILQKMNRQHTREEYIKLIDNIRNIIPDCAISHDIITGFCSETEEDHQETLSLMEYVKYGFGYMFSCSERPGTLAERKLEDNITPEIKQRRLAEIVALQLKHSAYRTKQFVGKTVEVLIEKQSKKSDLQWSGRTPQSTVAVFPKEDYKIGDFVNVKINECTGATLIGEAVGYSENN
jgi:tRNA-2-methylthio-N6-dimethylallyladenosine synthase